MDAFRHCVGPLGVAVLAVPGFFAARHHCELNPLVFVACLQYLDGVHLRGQLHRLGILFGLYDLAYHHLYRHGSFAQPRPENIQSQTFNDQKTGITLCCINK